MEPEKGESWAKAMPFMGLTQNLSFSNQSFNVANLQQCEQNWENNMFSQFNDQNKIPHAEDGLNNNNNQDWDPKATLSNLSFLEQKIHQLQELVHIIVGHRSQVTVGVNELATQQQLITANLTSIIMQLTSTAASLLPSVNNGQLNDVFFPPAQKNMSDVNTHVQNCQVGPTENRGETEKSYNCMDGHELKEEDDEEHLPPGSYEILQLEKEEILAPHAHFCTICGKGFKRNANLRMHMRGHGDEYKTLAALAKPQKESEELEPVILKRCNTKKFSIISDLKTHEKHCGKDKWLCSCGTSFSRKDKLFGHIALFQGHTPALPYEENKVLVGSSSDPAENGEASNNKLESMTFSDDSNGFGVFMGFDGCNMVGLQEYAQSAYDDSETSFPFLQ